jgi:hypothetical protein
MTTRIFISHSAADEKLAGALVDCILGTMVIADDELRCTSVPGHKLPVGSDFAATLLNDIGESSVVVGLVTQNAIASSWVLFELGATWGSKKNLMPLVTDEVDLKALPGPLSGRHVAKIGSKGDLNQFLEELANVVDAKRRSAAKSLVPMEKLVDAHTKHLAASTRPKAGDRVETKSKEPIISGLPVSELMSVLRNEKVTVPAKLAGEKSDKEMTVFELFIANSHVIAGGLQSDWERNTGGGFLYYEVGLRLVSYGLVQFDKLPAAQAKWFKRLTISAEGGKFLVHCKRLGTEAKNKA